jgi:phosphoribosylaminoimidazole carboxylase PurE protein
METKELKGIDSLLSTVQMPSGVPVATVSIGKTGAKNAGILALQILAVTDRVMAKKLEKLKRTLVESVRNKNRSRKSG